VSNHGGRQLDGAIATIDALPDIVDEVAGRVPVLLDGGIYRGTDVLKALALSARAVLIGRPYLWGLAAAGEPGVRRVLEEGMANGVFAHGDPKLLAFALFGAVNWIPRWYSPDGPASSQAIADLFADFFVAGFRTGGASR